MGHLSVASKYTVICGAMYFVLGWLFVLWPGQVQVIFHDAEFVGREAALMRVIGLTVAIIGWFYVFGGWTGSRLFVTSTVLDRLIFVPVVLLPLVMAEVFPHLLMTFCILDPALALGAWYLLRRA